MSNHWHYQLMRHPDGSYAVHEMYPLDDGDAWTENPVSVTGESFEDVQTSLLLMLGDIERYGVKDYEIEETTAGPFDEYSHYGENNPPLMSKPGDKDYEV